MIEVSTSVLTGAIVNAEVPSKAAQRVGLATIKLPGPRRVSIAIRFALRIAKLYTLRNFSCSQRPSKWFGLVQLSLPNLPSTLEEAF